ncbi:hypothetical protein XH96_13645 [Bradyrhizobium sp. CCBAU 51765]|nr:hypothetical protein XH96_13645 [Bradyrhizobium sp. CCBAU 51765]
MQDQTRSNLDHEISSHLIGGYIRPPITRITQMRFIMLALAGLAFVATLEHDPEKCVASFRKITFKQ